jgi:hypothetical protein
LEPYKVVASKPGAKAYNLRVVHASVQEVPLPVEYLPQA